MMEGLLGAFDMSDPRKQGLMGFAQGLLQGGSASQEPLTLGRVFAPAVQGATQGFNRGIAGAADLIKAQKTGSGGDMPALIQEYRFAVDNDKFQGTFGEFIKQYKQRETENFGVAPTYYQRDGKWHAAQFGNRGSVNPLEPPGGGEWAPPGLDKEDLPDRVNWRDRAGNIVATTPKNISGAEEQKGAAGVWVEDYKEIAKKARAASAMIPTLQRMSQLSPDAYEGKAAPLMQTLRSFLTSFGIPSDKVAAGEELTMFSNKGVLEGIGGSLGTGISNSDVGLIKETFPGLTTSAAGRQKLVDSLLKLKNREIEVRRLAEEYMADNGSLKGFNTWLARWAAENPLFPQQPQRGGMVGAPGEEIVGGGVVQEWTRDPVTGQPRRVR